MGHEIRELVHQVDSQSAILDAHMNMHARDQHPPSDVGELPIKFVVAFLVRVAHISPFGSRVARYRQRQKAVPLRDRAHYASQPSKFLAGLLDRIAHAGSDLDLALQEFRADLVREGRLTLGHQRL